MAAARRKPRNLHDFFVLSTLSITKESISIILQHLPLFTSIAVLLMFPMSSATMMSLFLLHRLPVSQLALQIQTLSSFYQNSYCKLLYHKLSETIIAYMLCFPFLITFSMLGRAAVAHTVASIYVGNKPSWQRVVKALPRLWKSLVVTYMCASLIVMACSFLIFIAAWAIINSLLVLGLPSEWEIWAGLCAGIVYSIVFGHVVAVCNLGTIVCVVEDGCCGMEAIWRAKFLMKARTQVGLLMFVLSSLTFLLVEIIFQFRVVGIGGNHWWINVWEAFMAIFMHSLLGVMDVVMSCVFYYTCKAATLDGLCPHNWSLFPAPVADAFSSTPDKIIIS